MKTFLDGRVTLHGGDAMAVVKVLADCSIDSIVTDPPYALTANHKRYSSPTAKPCGEGTDGSFRRLSRGFMGKQWDTGETAFAVEFWAEILRVLKPGGHVAAFGGTRSYHRLACAIEDAGFEIRDQLAWVYGQGFPKSHDVSKGIDKAAGAEREVIGINEDYLRRKPNGMKTEGAGCYGYSQSQYETDARITAPATDAARQWEGWGTALKPAVEYICLAQKPVDLSGLSIIVAHKIVEAACQLSLFARDADRNSQLSRSVFAEGFDSAQWHAVAECNTPAALCGLMDTWQSKSALPSSLSTALSWLNTLGAVLRLGSTFTTEMKSSLTTDLKILNSLLSQNTPHTTVEALTHTGGIERSASLVARLFSVVSDRLECIRQLIALGPVTEPRQFTPNLETICLARKPLSEKTVAANVLRWGTGAINVDGCRIEGGERPHIQRRNDKSLDGDVYGSGINGSRNLGTTNAARWPANLCHDGSQEVLAAFPETKSGVFTRRKTTIRGDNGSSFNAVPTDYEVTGSQGGDSGSAARFYYSAKASKADRSLSKHPTVKPVKLMQWLVRLITPPGGTTLDPFSGTGTTGEAAWREGFSAVLIEREEEYQADIERRMLFAKAKPKAEPAARKPKRDCDPGTLPFPEPLPLASEVAYQTTLAAE